MTNRGLLLTKTAIIKQLNGFGQNLFDVGLKSQPSDAHPRGKLLQRMWEYDQVTCDKNIAWLRSENASGRDIFIRPSGFKSSTDDTLHYPAIILVDDLQYKSIIHMEKEGFKPALVVETSPQNFQAWVYLTHKLLSPDKLLFYARRLQSLFDGDKGAAQSGQYGRLAGFANKKEKYNSPFVKCYSSNYKVAANAEKLLKELDDLALNKEFKHANKSVSTKYINLRKNKNLAKDTSQEEADAIFINKIHEYQNKYGVAFDASVAEWMITIQLLSNNFTADVVANCFFLDVPQYVNAPERKGNHVSGYIERTITKAWNEIVSNGNPIPKISDKFHFFINDILQS